MAKWTFPVGFAVLGLGFLVILFVFMDRKQGIDTLLATQVVKGQVVAQMRFDLLAGLQAEKEALLADSQEEARLSAERAREASQSVEKGLARLKDISDQDAISKQKDVLGAFERAWAEARAIDKQLWELLVQKTNDQASRLSFTQGFEVMSRFEAALEGCVTAGAANRNSDRIAQACFQALAQSAMILALQSPHIAEATEEGMTRIEARMQASAALVRQSLRQAGDGGADPHALALSMEAFRQFEEVNAEVVRLSRINSDVKSLALSLQKKRTAAAACEDALAELQELINARLSKATR